ncbi:flavonoid O-methyltransferase-like protein Os11g0303600 [Lolium perenne]|uniref:flavonoid O-methyltransferase-like protein Os11g0303600 n=1 Tax=Lolium perenne TaxID=4522 RepID=UPI0021F641C0|nr:flavonoid O-methyltransferase-like protein Os11g0303600 [Lolium perenne]
MAASFSEELLQAHAELWNHTFSYLKSMALECAIKLGIPTAIHRCGGAASLPDLLATLPVPENKKSYLPRLMTFLAVSGIFTVDFPTTGECANGGADGTYRLTPLSRLLVDDDTGAGADRCTNFSPFVLSQTNRYLVTAALHLSEWFESDEGSASAGTPFKMAHGTDLWTIMSRDPTINQVFNAGMASDTQFTMNFVVNNCSEVFDGLTSLVDVGGGNGTSARAIAKAFPHIKCSVLDLPIVINSTPADGVVKYIAGDMMSLIPMADAVFLKHVLHDWNDEVCVKILTECRKAIPKSGGKVIIMDVVVGSPSEANYEGQVMSDLLMMVITSGKERDEHEWRKIFMDAGFSHYKTRSIVGCLSITELYP